jgi:glycosyltransferase involved in cell wall biosynthesis
MKILQVCHRYYPLLGGVQEHVRNISIRLAKKYEVVIATTDPVGTLPREEFVEGIRVLRFRSWAPGGAYYFSRELRNYLTCASRNFDIVHAHSYHDLPALYASKAKTTNRLVFTTHYHGIGHTLLRSFLQKPYIG